MEEPENTPLPQRGRESKEMAADVAASEKVIVEDEVGTPKSIWRSASHRIVPRIANERLTSYLAGAATIVWLYYFLIQKLPLTSDENYFAHVFWLMRQGQRQYVDFYEVHLPLYFDMLSPLLPRGDGLGFIWLLRGLSLIVLGVYAAMLRPALWPILLMFALFGRMVEIRPDTIGLLLFNVAWLLLLRGRSNALLAAGLGALAILFSARAAVMMVPLALLCLYFEWRRPWPLLAMGAAFVAGLAIVYALAPAWSELVIRSAFIDTLDFDLPMTERFLPPERIILLTMITSAVVVAASRLRKEYSDTALITLIAGAAQLALILVDPAPYEYAYAWSAVPVVIGLPGSDRLKAVGALAFAALIVAAVVIYPFVKGRPPGPGSFLVVTPEAALGDVASMPTEELVPLLFDRHALWNQLRVRQEICRRIDGRVLTYFWYQPICLHDAFYDWFAFTWPKSSEWSLDPPPALVIWGGAGQRPDQLPSGYDVHDGFALRQHPSPAAAGQWQ